MGWCFVDARACSVYQCVCVCVCVCGWVCVCGIPAAEQPRKVTPNSQSGAELSMKGEFVSVSGNACGKAQDLNPQWTAVA